MILKRCLIRSTAYIPVASLLLLGVAPSALAAVGTDSGSLSGASGNSASTRSASNGLTANSGSSGNSSSSGAASSGSEASNDIASEAAPFVSNTQGAPPFGTSVQLGNFGNALAGMESATALPAFAPQGITVTPSLGVEEQYTTADFQNGSGRGGNFITSVRPGLLVAGQTPRVNVVFNYDPQIQVYSSNSYGDRISQSLNGALDAALIPGELNLALRGFVTTQATFGGLAPGGSTLLGQNNTTLTQSYSVEPSFQHQFSGAGTLDLAYILGITRQNGNTAYLPNTSSPYFQNGDLTSQTETASFTTVPIFLRFDDVPSITMTEDTGTGVLNNAHQYFFDNTVRYALTRHALLIASGGYENLRYAGIPPTRINDPTWSIGVDLTPAQNASIIIRYQHRYGFNAPYLVAIYPITARTTWAASYTDELSTQQQQIGASVAGSSLNSFGLPISGVGGSPVLLTNQALAIQSALQRQSVMSFSSTTTFSRDSVGFSLLRENEKLVAAAPGYAGFSQSSLSGTINYTHQLSEAASFSAYLDYTKLNSIAVGAGTTSTYATAFTYNYQFNPSLSGYAQYLLTNQNLYGYGQNINGFGGTSLQNSVIIGIQKTF